MEQPLPLGDRSGVNIRGVAFDIGGVLEITPDLGVFSAWERRWGLPPGALGAPLADVWDRGALGQIGLDAVHGELERRLGRTAVEVEAFMEEMWRQYLGSANNDLIAYARSLRPRYRTGILSNSFVGAREREQAAYGFEDIVDAIVYSHETGLAKPDQAIYALACRRLGTLPQETIFLDDAPIAVDGARAAGLHAFLFRSNGEAIADIEALLAG